MVRAVRVMIPMTAPPSVTCLTQQMGRNGSKIRIGRVEHLFAHGSESDVMLLAKLLNCKPVIPDSQSLYLLSYTPH